MSITGLRRCSNPACAILSSSLCLSNSSSVMCGEPNGTARPPSRSISTISASILALPWDPEPREDRRDARRAADPTEVSRFITQPPRRPEVSAWAIADMAWISARVGRSMGVGTGAGARLRRGGECVGGERYPEPEPEPETVEDGSGLRG